MSLKNFWKQHAERKLWGPSVLKSFTIDITADIKLTVVADPTMEPGTFKMVPKLPMVGKRRY